MNVLSRFFVGPGALVAGWCWMSMTAMGLAAPGDAAAAETEKPLVAEWSISPNELSPNATVEVVFPTSMIPKEQIGEVAKESLVVTKPELEGEFQWTSTRSGEFHVREAPKFNASYQFFLRSGVTDLAGRALSTDRLGSANSASFRAIDRHPRWYYSNESQRVPRFMFEFNDQVDPKKVVKHLRYVSEEPAMTLEAKVRHATAEDFESFKTEPQSTWAEEVTGVAPSLAPGASRMSALVIEPSKPLPVGNGWRLVLDETLENASGRDSLANGDSVHLGEIRAFAVTGISAHTPFDSLYFLDVSFNSRLTSGREAGLTDEERLALAEKLAMKIVVEPEPAGGLKAELIGRTVRLAGDFSLNTPYRVVVEPGTEAGNGLKLSAPVEQEVTFVPNPPHLAAQAFVRTQLAAGSGDFEATAANVKSVRCRVKRLSGPELLQAIDLYGDYQSAFYQRSKAKEPYRPVSFSEYPGEEIHDQTFQLSKPLDKSALIKLNWKEILKGRAAGALFVEMEGVASPGLDHQGVVTQSLVQLTDLGIMQKSNGKETLLFVSSLSSGKPVSGVRVTLVEDGRQLLGYGDTDASGVVRVTGKNPDYVLAEKDGDAAVLRCVDGESDISWVVPYDIPRAWDDVWEPQRRTFVFTDRPLYRPGEVLHLKAHSRLLVGDTWQMDPRPRRGHLVIRDPEYRKVIEREVTFSATGAIDADITMPEAPLGWYEISLEVDAEKEGEDSEYAGSISVRVDDYRANTFEVKLNGDEARMENGRIYQPLSANYYMGKKLSQAKVMWSAFAEMTFDAPEGFGDYHFGDAPSWSNYGKDRDAEAADEEGMPLEDWFVSGDTHLGEEGTAEFELPLPPEDRSAMPRTIRVSAEVTDINQQTISASGVIELAGAEFLLGVRGPEYFGRAGQETMLEVVGVTAEGKAAGAGAEVQVTIERQEYHTLKVATAGGGTTTKDQVILREELKQAVALAAGEGSAAPSVTIPFTPERSGTYFVTAEAVDGKGTKIFSRLPLYVVGSGEFPWAMEDGSRILLQPEKTELLPGEEAVIVVKTPIAGTALVTVERNRVHRHFVAEVSPEQPLVRVPMTAEDAPNVFVSVVVMRGSLDSPKALKMPEYKVGYCELTVKSDAKDLKVAITSDREEVLPGERVAVTATITDAAGTVVPGAEVTLFAVDEGVLSLMNHETPDPAEEFGQPFPLAMDNLTSLEDLMSEDRKMRSRGNKGFLIGGGGDFDQIDAMPTRKHFVTTPLWLASVMTDAKGQVKAQVEAPDGLTRYRVMAVAMQGLDRYGSGEGMFKVNKPLMIEPVVPRFARVGDELLVKAVVHNTTPHSGTVEVSLEVDEDCSLIREPRFFVPASLLKPNSKGEGRLQSQTIRLEAGETAAVAFPVSTDAVGAAEWLWMVRTKEWPEHAPGVSDAVETKFEIHHPVPELRDVRYTRLTAGEGPENFLSEVAPSLLEGKGSVLVSVSNTQLFEARDALEYVLRYPYGCVEQSTSATLPWLALGDYQSVFPELLGEGQAKVAIQKGVNRLLQMITSDGGLAYWPGGHEASFWGSAYGGLMLLKARDSGADVPDSVIDSLMDFLSKKLRGLEEDKDSYVQADAALALYTLARGGRPEPAYLNLLHGRRSSLPEVTRLQLALAMCLSETPESQIKEALGWTPKPKESDEKKDEKKEDVATRPSGFGSWAGTAANDAMRLICYVHLGLSEDADDVAARMLQRRNGRGDWGNTFANAWSLTAMVAYERSLRREGKPVEAMLAWGGEKGEVTLEGIASEQREFSLKPQRAAEPLKVSLSKGDGAFVRVEAKGFPPFRNFEPVNKGYSIARTYERLLANGETTDLSGLRVGDMVVVNLDIEINGGDRYLAINDPLPAVFEAINPEFETQNARGADQLPEGIQNWFCDHRELRSDRALFFTNYAPSKGKFRLRYLARAIAEGETIAPPAKIEAMYAPETYGLSATEKIRTLPSVSGESVAAE